MRTYVKIPTLYNRDVGGSKKLIEGDFRDETVAFLRDNEWICTEKIDGTNIRVHWDGHEVQFGGRTDKAQIPVQLGNHLKSVFCTPEAEELFEQKFGAVNVTLFGEGYGGNIQAGMAYRKDVSFILFDVLIDSETPIWLRRADVEDVARCFGIEVVPALFIGTLQQAVDFVKTKPKSTIGTANMEGIVARPKVELQDRMGRRVIVKIKVKDFV